MQLDVNHWCLVNFVLNLLYYVFNAIKMMVILLSYLPNYNIFLSYHLQTHQNLKQHNKNSFYLIISSINKTTTSRFIRFLKAAHLLKPGAICFVSYSLFSIVTPIITVGVFKSFLQTHRTRKAMLFFFDQELFFVVSKSRSKQHDHRGFHWGRCFGVFDINSFIVFP